LIGKHNTFEVGAEVECPSIGDYNTFECLCKVGPKTIVPSGCTIGAGCVVLSEEELASNMVIYGSNCDRKVYSTERPRTANPQIDFLSKVLVNYHFVKKPTKSKEASPTEANPAEAPPAPAELSAPVAPPPQAATGDIKL